MRRAASCVLVMLLSFTSGLLAQGRTPVVRIGDNVRFTATLVGAAADTTSMIRCEARVSRLRLDTLLVRPFGLCAQQPASMLRLHDLHLQKRNPSRLANVAIGAAVGTLGGVLAGLVIVGDGCRRAGCDGGLSVAVFTLGGAVSGGLIGTTIGFLLPAGTRWVPSPDRAVRLDDR